MKSEEIIAWLDHILNQIDWQKKNASWFADENAIRVAKDKDIILAIRERIQNSEDLNDALSDLYYVVKRECPSLLCEDSGGDAELDYKICKLLEKNNADK